jgi:hypothetical protein
MVGFSGIPTGVIALLMLVLSRVRVPAGNCVNLGSKKPGEDLCALPGNGEILTEDAFFIVCDGG